MSNRFIIAIATWAVASATQATIINVPGDAPSIQGAIDAASAGDTVLVAAGTYTGTDNKNLDFGGKDLVLAGKDGAASTVIDCQMNGTGLHLKSGETRASLVTGFTITGGTGGPFGKGTSTGGGGVLLESASPTIRECIIENNLVSPEGAGGGIFMDLESSPLIDRCIIRDNNGVEVGGGLLAIRGSEPTIRDCQINNNRAVAGGGIALFSSGPGAEISGCDISDNQADAAGGGIVVVKADGRIDRCVVRNNVAGFEPQEGFQGGGIVFIQEAFGTVTRSLIEGNTSSFSGGGIAASQSSVLVMNACRVKDNHCESFGAGIQLENSQGTITNCVIDGNRLESNFGSGGGAVATESSVSFENCTFTGNGGGFLGSDLAGEGQLTVQNCIARSTGRSTIQFQGQKTIRYSNVLGGEAGEGNIDADPLFASKAGFDYVLWRNSPSIDSGTGTDDGLDWCEVHAVYCRFNAQTPDMGAYGGPGNTAWLD